MAYNPMSGPIPGENYTSDTKNYPWHRPPEHTDLDKAIDDIAKKLLGKDNIFGMVTLLETGITIRDFTQMLLMSGMAKGKWTLDFALLLAGPTAHIIKLICDAYEIDAEMGIDDEDDMVTSAYLNEIKNIGKPMTEELTTEEKTSIVDTVKSGMGSGFMSGAPKGEI